MYFSEEDKKQIENLEYKEELEPNYEFLKSCLIWEDERPQFLSEEGYDKLATLWIARFFMYHSEMPEEKWWVIDKNYFKEAWKLATESGVKWPGFEKDRLYLSDVDKEYLRFELSKSNEF